MKDSFKNLSRVQVFPITWHLLSETLKGRHIPLNVSRWLQSETVFKSLEGNKNVIELETIGNFSATAYVLHLQPHMYLKQEIITVKSWIPLEKQKSYSFYQLRPFKQPKSENFTFANQTINERLWKRLYTQLYFSLQTIRTATLPFTLHYTLFID